MQIQFEVSPERAEKLMDTLRAVIEGKSDADISLWQLRNDCYTIQARFGDFGDADNASCWQAVGLLMAAIKLGF